MTEFTYCVQKDGLVQTFKDGVKDALYKSLEAFEDAEGSLEGWIQVSCEDSFDDSFDESLTKKRESLKEEKGLTEFEIDDLILAHNELKAKRVRPTYDSAWFRICCSKPNLRLEHHGNYDSPGGYYKLFFWFPEYHKYWNDIVIEYPEGLSRSGHQQILDQLASIAQHQEDYKYGKRKNIEYPDLSGIDAFRVEEDSSFDESFDWSVFGKYAPIVEEAVETGTTARELLAEIIGRKISPRAKAFKFNYTYHEGAVECLPYLVKALKFFGLDADAARFEEIADDMHETEDKTLMKEGVEIMKHLAEKIDSYMRKHNASEYEGVSRPRINTFSGNGMDFPYPGFKVIFQK